MDAPAGRGEYREAIASLATAVTVITSRGESGPVGMTASAVASLSLEPTQLLVCVSRSIRTHRILERRARFAVNVLGEGQQRLALRFASPSGDRFAGIETTEHEGVPILGAAIAYFVCDVAERHPGGDHSIFVGVVRRHHHLPGSRPLLHFARDFGSLERPEAHLLHAWLDGAA